jgi:hypothetical protein
VNYGLGDSGLGGSGGANVCFFAGAGGAIGEFNVVFGPCYVRVSSEKGN